MIHHKIIGHPGIERLDFKELKVRRVHHYLLIDSTKEVVSAMMQLNVVLANWISSHEESFVVLLGDF